MKILEMVISHFVYPSILKRSQKAISRIQRQQIDGFLDPKYVGLTGVCEAWTKFVNIASYKSTVYGSLSDSFCGNAQVRRPRVDAGSLFKLHYSVLERQLEGAWCVPGAYSCCIARRHAKETIGHLVTTVPSALRSNNS